MSSGRIYHLTQLVSQLLAPHIDFCWMLAEWTVVCSYAKDTGRVGRQTYSSSDKPVRLTIAEYAAATAAAQNMRSLTK